MSKDPAFLFYDGDAARDVSHMNRLERGCYFDLIQAQRKFGRLSEDLIKKILGKDYETCWDNIKICLTYVEHMYFIEWLEESTQKRRAYSESRKKNRNSHKEEHMSNICETYVEHMENENENVNKDKNIYENGVSEFGGPSLFEVRELFISKNYSEEEAKKFWNYYESSGWEDKHGRKIKGWRAKVDSWVKNSFNKPEVHKPAILEIKTQPSYTNSLTGEMLRRKGLVS